MECLALRYAFLDYPGFPTRIVSNLSKVTLGLLITR